jgi:hypothetical protein
MANPDYWVRQISASTGRISPKDAMGAMEHIQRNMDSGLYPTTGGAVSLMHKDDVDELFRANRGLFPKFRPQIPDRNGGKAKTIGDWYIAAIEQALFHGSRPFETRQITAMDGFLNSYVGSGVDWRRIHSFALSKNSRVRPYQQGLSWLSTGEPLSVAAFVAP